MPDPNKLSRRRRQVLEAVFARGEASVNQVVEDLPDAPTSMAVRRMMHILVEQGFLNRRQDGREVIYFPARSQTEAGETALQDVLNTFFDGEIEEALASHLSKPERVSEEKLERLQKLIGAARKQGN